MKRTIVLLIDVVSFVGFAFLTTTGILLHYVLPPGSGRWSDIWGLSRHEWGAIHFYIAVAFFCVLSLHLIIHWRVLVNLLRGHRQAGASLRLGLGVVGVLTVLALAFSPLITPVSIETKTERGGWRHLQKFNPAQSSADKLDQEGQ
jgi:hypothetical protein